MYSKSDLFGFAHTQSVSPVSTSLPKSEIEFSIDNVSGEYNPYNEQGLAKYLMSRQEVKTRYGVKVDGSVEWIKGGTFYLSDWFAKQNGLSAEFKARDLFEFMSAFYVDDHDLSSRTLYDLAERVLIAADLPLNGDGTVKWVIDESLRSISTTAPLPRDTLANCLQLIANAAKCVLYQDRDGVLRIEPLKFDVSDYEINAFNSYSKSEVTLSKEIKQVNVKVYAYTQGRYGAESTTSTVAIVVGQMGETIDIDNPLIVDTENALALGEWIATHLGHRMTLESSWRSDVRLDPLDIVTNENDYKTSYVRMTEVKYEYNGAFRGTGQGKVI